MVGGPCSARPPVGADRLLIVFSDIEMGAGGVLDDFPHTDWLGELILSYNEGVAAGVAADLVFNGDTFDLLKTSWEGAHPHTVTAEIAVGKMGRIIEAHPRFFDALARFLDHPEPRDIHFVVGNHDAELLFPEVRLAILDRIGSPDVLRGRVHFPGFALSIGDVYLEHGNQMDPMFRMEEPHFVPWNGQPVLNLAWGAVTLLDVAMPLQPYLYHHDRLRPRERVFELMPELRELIVDAFWRYWTRDYWQGFFDRSDPVKRITWTMVRELAHRFQTYDAGVRLDLPFIRRMEERDDFRLYLLGHLHAAGLWTWCDRRVMQTGAMRNEFLIDRSGSHAGNQIKVYAEAWLRKGRVARASLVELEGPEPPPGYVPASIFEVLDQVRPILGSPRDREIFAEKQAKQEALEASDGPGGRGTSG